MLFVNKKHPKFGNAESVTFEEIIAEKFVMLLETCDARMLIQNAFTERGEAMQISSEIEFWHSILGFIEANIGISITAKIFNNGLPLTDFDVKRKVSLIARDEQVGKKKWRCLNNLLEMRNLNESFSI